MALTLTKTKKAAELPAADNPAAGKSPVGKPTAVAAVAKAFSFLKRGKAAQETLAKEEAIAEQRAKDRVRMFYLKDGVSTVGTFLDGEIKDGALDIPYLYMHTSIFLNGSYNNHFICVAEQESCPICEGGLTPSYVGLLTLLDHGPNAEGYHNKKDPSKPYKDQLSLLVAKRNSCKLLTTAAIKRKGLTGCTFDISRTGDKEAAIGNVYDFTDKNTLADLAKEFGTKDKVIAPLNYDKVMQDMYLSADQLHKLGFGTSQGAVGAEPAQAEDYSHNV